MTGEAGHVRIAMRQLLIIPGHISPGRRVGAHGLGIARLHTVVLGVGSVRVNRIDRLLDAPPTARHDH